MTPEMVVQFITKLLALLKTAPVVATPAPVAGACNGLESICLQRYSNVSLIGTHGSPFFGSRIDPRYNQEKTVTQQLDGGIRFLQSQTHNDEHGTLSMCHTSCDLLNAGPLDNYLGDVKTFLDANPNEVITLLIVNGDNIDPTAFDKSFTSTKISNYAFIPASPPATLAIDQWPTYSDLIKSNKRLVVFLDSKADTSKVPYILPEFDYFFETPYDTTDPSFNQCTLDRPANSSSEGKMYIVNHFLDTPLGSTSILIPDNAADYTTNSPQSILGQANLCKKTYNRNPNVILVDQFDRASPALTPVQSAMRKAVKRFWPTGNYGTGVVETEFDSWGHYCNHKYYNDCRMLNWNACGNCEIPDEWGWAQ